MSNSKRLSLLLWALTIVPATAVIAVFLLVGQTVYFIAVGGFIQPSVYGY